MRPTFLSIILLAIIGGASGCGQTPEQGATGPAPLSTPQLPIVPMPEASQYRALAAGGANITWIEPAAAGSEWDPTAGKDQAANAIRDSAAALAAVDYPAFSLPDFVTYTRALKPQPSHFSSQDLEIEAFGRDPQGGRWALYRWQGSELPQHPDRLLVHRWIRVYVLYDVTNGRVVRLLPTIQGEVLE